MNAHVELDPVQDRAGAGRWRIPRGRQLDLVAGDRVRVVWAGTTVHTTLTVVSDGGVTMAVEERCERSQTKGKSGDDRRD